MTREEAIKWLKVINTKKFGWDEFALQESQREIRERCEQGVREAIDMAIEALSQPIVAKHFDIQSGYIYCSPQIAENVKVVVRCKNCRYCTEHYDRDGYPYWMCKEWDGGTDADGFCHCGERREE